MVLEYEYTAVPTALAITGEGVATTRMQGLVHARWPGVWGSIEWIAQGLYSDQGTIKEAMDARKGLGCA